MGCFRFAFLLLCHQFNLWQATRSAEPQFGTSVGSGLTYVRPELGFGTTGSLP